MDKPTAIITGISGQDGTYLASLLISKGYNVIGTSRSTVNEKYLAIKERPIKLETLDLGDYFQIKRLVKQYQPKEIYNLAARASSSQLFDDPIETAKVNGLAPTYFLEAIRQESPHSRFCQASSSEIFAGCNSSPQDEHTPFQPINVYGSAKTYATNVVSTYRNHFSLFACTAILYNHESPLRPVEFVTRKITNAVAKIANGKARSLTLGSIDSQRDWGFAGDYVLAMWMMLQHSVPEDFIIATGKTHSIRQLCDIAFSYVDLDYRDFVQVKPMADRRVESVELRGNPAKAKERLGWSPSLNFQELIHMMVAADLSSPNS